ncbi:putative motility protein [Phytohalomonas tamaricis]|uniref:putative motility protein n=1 Tax=Phytohalomonas tamaricis TaxID=2081032 RepID=UPI000D0B8DEA|nr:putative motility protein [Phytohalomonas tamaricis]
MDLTVNGTVSEALAMQQAQTIASAQTKVLKMSMDAQADQVTQLMASVSPTAQLATEGAVGTRINTFA